MSKGHALKRGVLALIWSFACSGVLLLSGADAEIALPRSATVGFERHREFRKRPAARGKGVSQKPLNPALLVRGALVGGAALANYFEMAPAMELSPKDSFRDRIMKQSISLLLVSSFAMEVLVVFMTTVQVTNLLGTKPDRFEAVTAMGMLHGNYEFEYVACRLFFLQGLLNWLGAIGLGLVRDDKDSKSLASTKAFKSSIGSCIFGIMVMIIAFYNHHLTFYNNYLHMVWRFFYLAFKRYYVNWPPRSLPFVALLPFGYAVRRLYAAFAQPSSITAAQARKSQGVV